MGYRIDYPAARKIRGADKRRSRRAAMTGLCLLVFLLLVGCLWPRGKRVLQGVLFSGDVAVTAAALENLTTELKAGEELGSALSAFCQRVIRESMP